MPSLLHLGHLGRDLNLEPTAGEESIDRALVLVEPESIRDHGLGIDDALGEHGEGALEAVEDRHRADDLDLVVVDAKSREGGGRVRVGHAKHQKSPTPRDPSQCVFDSVYQASRVVYHVANLWDIVI